MASTSSMASPATVSSKCFLGVLLLVVLIPVAFVYWLAPGDGADVGDGGPLIEDGPVWGCGLLGVLPGIAQDGTTEPETQQLVDALKSSSSFDKVAYWNWNKAPEKSKKTQEEQHISKDFIFMPSEWGVVIVNPEYVRKAGESPFIDGNEKVCNARMSEVWLGSNEPDIQGSCMGTLFGKCRKGCSEKAKAENDCPQAYLTDPPAGAPTEANSNSECNCWQTSNPSGCGYFPVDGCKKQQPLIDLFDGSDPDCIDRVMYNWKQTAQIAVSKGYKYLTTPMVAVDINYTENFIKRACTECEDASCGCPVYIVFHFYSYDCQPESTGGYTGFQSQLDKAAAVMDKYPFIKGVFVNEVGMLNCRSFNQDPICIPNSGKHPATSHPQNQCESNDELPDGLSTFMAKIMQMVRKTKTKGGRRVVKQFSWFNIDMDGGTYNLRLFDDDGKVNDLGKTYMRECSKWGEEIKTSSSVVF